MLENTPDIITVKELKEILHCGRTKIMELIHTGVLDAHFVAGKWLIFRVDLEEFIKRA